MVRKTRPSQTTQTAHCGGNGFYATLVDNGCTDVAMGFNYRMGEQY